MTEKSDLSLKELLSSSRFLWIGLAILISALIITGKDLKEESDPFNIIRINKKIQKIDSRVNADLKELESILDDNDYDFLLNEYDYFIEELSTRNGYSIYIFERDSIVFWSDNSIPVNSRYSANSFSEGIIFATNTWGLCQELTVGEYKLVGITLLQRSYPYENNYLSNEFIFGRGQASESTISISEVPGAIPVSDDDGEVLFYLQAAESGNQLSAREIIIVILYLLLVLAVILLVQDLFVLGIKHWRTNWWLVALAADLILIRWLMIKFSIPGPLYETSFFTPFDKGSFFFNSHGDLILSAIFIFLFAHHFRQWFRLYPSRLVEKDKSPNQRIIDSFTIVGWVSLLLVFFGMNWLFEGMLRDRETLLEVHKVLSLNISNLADLFFFIIVLAAFSQFVRSVICQLVPHYTPLRLILIVVISLVLVMVFSRLWGFVPRPLSLLLLLALVGVFAWPAYLEHVKLNHSSSVLVIILGSIFLINLFYVTNQEKEYLVRSQLLENLTDEHDLIAEMLFEDIDNRINSDENLPGLVLNTEVSEEEISSYLKSNYFGFYWNKYNIGINVCDSLTRLEILIENREEPSCIEFFDSEIGGAGSQIPGTGFYYLDNFDGLIDYRAKYIFFNQDSSFASHLFITLQSRLLPQELGYPDLLISQGENRRDSLLQGYSYAKYESGKLISRAGSYVYSTNSDNYPEELGRVVRIEEDKYVHLIYKIDSDQTIILSSSRFRLWDHIVSFSYVFVLLYLIWLFVSSLTLFTGQIKRPGTGFKQKIEFVMVGVLVVSFILTGGGISYYIVNQYDSSNRNTIAEKTQSVLIEVSHKLSDEPFLGPDWSSEDYPTLGDLLVKFSIVFNSDINLYDLNGEVLATSRPEIFERKLIGTKMNPLAYHELTAHDQMEYIHFENIGNLKYWSAYVPFYNGYNELVAYLNLPYFAKQSVIRQEISTFIITILNAYFLLIFLAVVLAVILSNQVTRPLRLLQEKFAQMELGGVNQTVDYSKKDEIGSLVKSYNRMVDELEKSAEKLAKSERETAWREMARQIAHEIKNPLTPMKLSVQHLRRAWDDQAEDWEAYFNRVSETLIEQINSLSAIADEFAQFARMPQSKLKNVDIVKRIKKSVKLFNISEEGKVVLNGDIEEVINVYIDEEQVQQVFNNLLKNAFQSVPKSRKPRVNVFIRKDDDKVIIAFEDNGSGIDSDISERLFQPNFTTKSSGMGLGLAISKSIVDASGGKIWYETEMGKGSTFFLSLPISSH